MFLARATILLAVLSVTAARSPAAPTTAPAPSSATTTASTISWDQAAKHVGETVTVTGRVVSTHALSGGSRVVLNVGKDFPDKTRFTVLVTLGERGPGSTENASSGSAPTTAPTSAAASTPDANATYVGKTISVTGLVELYHDVAEIRAKSDEVNAQQ